MLNRKLKTEYAGKEIDAALKIRLIILKKRAVAMIAGNFEKVKKYDFLLKRIYNDN